MLPMIFRKVDLSFEKLGQWRRKWTDLSISLPQLQIGLNESWKLCLNLCLGWWLEPNLNLVNKSVTLGLWQLKTVLPEGRIIFKSIFLKIFKLSELRILGPVCSIRLQQKEKGILKKIWAKEAQFPVPSSFFKGFQTYNHFHNILRLFYILPNFPFTTSETKRDY